MSHLVISVAASIVIHVVAIWCLLGEVIATNATTTAYQGGWGRATLSPSVSLRQTSLRTDANVTNEQSVLSSRGSGKKTGEEEKRIALSEDESATIASIRLDDYLPAEVLTQRVRVIGDINPTPAKSDLSSIEGEAELMVLVSSDGHADAVIVVRSSLPSSLIDYAVKQFKAATYQPGRINSRSVRSRISIGLSIAY